MNNKCSFGDMTIKPNGINELDPCIYEDIEMYTNVTVVISRCKKCGHIHHINGAEYILSVHFGFSRYVTCEKCRKDTWHTKEFK